MTEKKTEKIKDKLTFASKETVAVVDAVFICDCTGSMSSYMDKAKDTARQILSDIKSTYSESSVFFGFVGYHDHGDPKVLEFMDLTGDIEEVIKFIGSLQASGGGDEAEAVVDALDCAAHKISWRPDAHRQLIHILDAPPHGSEFGGGDDYPKGCPCKLDYVKILKELDKMDTEYLVLNFTSSVDKMVSIYKKYHTRIENVPLVLNQDFGQAPMPFYPAPGAIPCAMPPPPLPPSDAMLPTGMAFHPPPPPMYGPPPTLSSMPYDMPVQQQQCEESYPYIQQEMVGPQMSSLSSAQPPMYAQMDITSQVTCQMAQNISTNVLSKVNKRFAKK